MYLDNKIGLTQILLGIAVCILGLSLILFKIDTYKRLKVLEEKAGIVEKINEHK
jgi:hypothetical protein